MYDRTAARGLSFVMATLVLLAVQARVASAETMTRSYRPTAVNTDGCIIDHYRGCPGSDGAPIDGIAICGRIKFTDPVPRGSIVTRLDVRVGIETRWSRATAPPESLIWAMNHSHTQPERIMGYGTQPISDATGCEPGHFQLLPIDGTAYDGGIPFYEHGGTNYAQVASLDEGIPPWMDVMELTFHYEPAAVVKFDLTSSAAENERRVLIHKFGSNDSYFAAAQEKLRTTADGADRRIEVRGTVTDADGSSLAGKKIYLRVADPPDTAAYVPAARRVAGDNADPAGGRIEVTNDQGQKSYVRATSVTADGSGRFAVVLLVTNGAAGDNYRIEASTLQDFGATQACGTPNNCYASGTFVAWKRVYLEVGRMFRRGSYITTTVDAGDDSVRVADRSPFAPGATVVLLHAPLNPTQPASPGDFWWAQRTIAPDGVEPDVAGPGGTLQLDAPLPSAFVGLVSANGLAPYPSTAADFVGVVTGDPAKDYYESNLAYIRSLFGEAFTDYVVMDPVPLPLVAKLVETPQAVQEETHPYVQRWFRHRGHPNHQFVFGSRNSGMADDGARGVTRAIDGFSYSHVVVPKILGLMATASSRRLLGEITAHEISHQWHTNRRSSHTTSGEHCRLDFRAWDDASKACLMRYSYEGSAGTLPEFMDDVVRFHYVVTASGADSEYRWIRERCDPVPAEPFLSPSDWWTMPPSPCR